MPSSTSSATSAKVWDCNVLIKHGLGEVIYTPARLYGRRLSHLNPQTMSARRRAVIVNPGRPHGSLGPESTTGTEPRRGEVIPHHKLPSHTSHSYRRYDILLTGVACEPGIDLPNHHISPDGTAPATLHTRRPPKAVTFEPTHQTMSAERRDVIVTPGRPHGSLGPESTTGTEPRRGEVIPHHKLPSHTSHSYRRYDILLTGVACEPGIDLPNHHISPDGTAPATLHTRRPPKAVTFEPTHQTMSAGRRDVIVNPWRPHGSLGSESTTNIEPRIGDVIPRYKLPSTTYNKKKNEYSNCTRLFALLILLSLLRCGRDSNPRPPA